MKVNYTVKGDTNGQSVILLHGWGGSINSLANLQELLSERNLNVYNMDLPGFGESEKPEQALSMEDFIIYLDRFIKELKIDKPILIGHSFGGKLAMAFSLKKKELISKIILINTSGINPKNSLKRTMFLVPAKIFGVVFNLPGFSKLKPIVRSIFYKLVVRERDYLKASEQQQETMKNVLKENLDNRIASIDLPTLLVWGEKDTQTPVWMGEKISRLIPGARLEVVKDATHGLPLKQPDIVADIIFNYLGT